MATDTTPAAPSPAAAPKKSFFRKPLGCLLTTVAAGLLFVVLILAFALWFAGSNRALDLGSKFVAEKSGGALTVAENDNNLFAGRIHLKGLEITNPGRFTDNRCFTLNELHAEVKPLSALGDRIEIPVLTLDIGAVSLVGSDKWKDDNNLLDFKKAFAPAGADEPKPEEKPHAKAAAMPHFHIAKLKIRIDKIRVVSHATTAGVQPKVVGEESLGLDWTFTDVTDENLVQTVLPVMKTDSLKVLMRSAKFAAAVAGSLGADQLKELLGGGSAAVTEALAGVSPQAAEAVTAATTKATEAVSSATTKATEKLGSLLKKKEKKPAAPAPAPAP